jgi:hypothetical protein
MLMAWIMGCMITNGGAGGGVCCNPSRPRGARRLARLVSGTLPCRAVSGLSVSWRRPSQPRLACHCHCHLTARRLASSRYQRPRRSATHHPTIPPPHDTATPCHDTIRHAPADAPSTQGPFRLEPRTSNLEPRQHAGTPSCRPSISPPVCFPLAPAASGAACVCITPNAATRFRCASPMDPLSHTPTAPCLGRHPQPAAGRSFHAND